MATIQSVPLMFIIIHLIYIKVVLFILVTLYLILHLHNVCVNDVIIASIIRSMYSLIFIEFND